MKRYIRILSVALAAVLMLSACSVSLALDDTSVYIPSKIEKLGLPDMPDYITLKTRTERAVMKNENGEPVYQTQTWYVNGEEISVVKYDYNGNPVPVYGIVNGADIDLQFSEKPDWVGVIWAEGYETLEVDDTGLARTSMEGHMRQPGTWSASGPCDPITGKPEWHVTGGDYAYMAGKGDVAAQYGRSGSVNYVEYTVQEDFFRTGMTGASTVIRWEAVQVITDCYKQGQGRHSYIVWEDTNRPVGYDPTTGTTDSFQTNLWGNIAYDDAGNMYCCQDGKTNYIPVDGSVIYCPKTNTLYDQTGYPLMILPPGACCCEKAQYPVSGGQYPDSYAIQVPVIVQEEVKPMTVWYISTVTTTYPQGNYIVEVETDWRNDAKKTLASYKITYEPKKGERYKITYSPATTTVFEDHRTGSYETWGSNIPSTDLQAYIKKNSDLNDRSYILFQDMYLHHYTEDEVLSGLYTSGKTTLCSGSGNNLKKWYKYYGTGTLNGVKVNNNGKQVKKNGLKPCTYFISPRVVD